jgi:hypothetical protein
MRVKLAAIVATVVIGLLMAGCGSNGNQPGTGSSTPNGAY